MVQTYKTACVFGGSGFIGRQIVKRLCDAGYIVRVITRVPEHVNLWSLKGSKGRVLPVLCDYRDFQNITQAVAGCDVAVNTIGILFEKSKRQNFHALHTLLPSDIAKACQKAGVKSFVHISALGVDVGHSRYAQSKHSGEKAVMSHFKDATILRPSIVFGAEDNFFNMFAKMAKFLPFLPLIGGGKTRFQPVYVGDVADATIAALDKPEAKGTIYELGGPDVADFKTLYKIMFSYTKQPRLLVPLPFFIAKVQALFLQMMPTPLLTRDQVESLKSDNIVNADMPTLKDLGIESKSMDLILPTYLG